MEHAADPVRPAHLMPAIAPSGRYTTPSTVADADRLFGRLSPPHRASVASTENLQLPSLRSLVSPLLLNSRHSDATPAPVTRLPSLTGFDHGLPASHPANGHGYVPREDSQASSSTAQSTASSSQPYPIYAPAASANGRAHPPVADSFYAPHRQESISSGVSAVSEHPSPRDESAESSTAQVRRRVDMSRAPVRATRCIGRQEVSGEGLCYVYEDGSYCRTVIDGEPVNPSWGVTKAGKPRKRLAQACLTCREKKIKCEPGVPKCTQCTRARRACRGGLSGPTPDDMNVDLSDALSSAKQRPEDPFGRLPSPSQQPQRTRSPSLQPFSDPRRKLVESAKSAAPESSRKRRFQSSSDQRDGVPSVYATPGFGTEDSEASTVNAAARNSLELDPHEADPVLTRNLLELFFAYVNSSTYAIFPKEPFMKWATSKQPKSSDDRLLIYSLLVMGNVFSSDTEWRYVERQLLDICNAGLMRRVGKFTLQTCQSRLFVGLAHFARGRHEEAWDWCGAFLRAISALKLNLEEGVRCLDDEGDYGLDQLMIEECRRRTFWAGFLMDRYNGFSGGTLFMIAKEDTLVRLPCTKPAYDSGHPAETPLFDGGVVEASDELWNNISPMGYHALISAIWGDVWTVSTRAARKPNTSLEDYEAFYEKTNARMEEWYARLPPQFQYSEATLDIAIQGGYAGTLIGLYALYYATIMRLNRYARHSSLPSHLITRNIARANAAARHLLTAIIAPVCKLSRAQRLGPNHSSAFATPFPGYAVLIATDILSAGGLASDLPTTFMALDNGLTFVEEIAKFWASARHQQKAVQTRVRLLAETAMGQGPRMKKVDGQECWRVEKPLEKDFAGRDDVVYGASDEVFFAALRGTEPSKRMERGMGMVVS